MSALIPETGGFKDKMSLQMTHHICALSGLSPGQHKKLYSTYRMKLSCQQECILRSAWVCVERPFWSRVWKYMNYEYILDISLSWGLVCDLSTPAFTLSKTKRKHNIFLLINAFLIGHHPSSMALWLLHSKFRFDEVKHILNIITY